MAPTTAPAPPKPSYSFPTDQRFVFRTVDWKTYRAFIDLLVESHVRLTYDRGSLEFMTVSHQHEWLSKLIGRLIETLTEELNIPVKSGGSTTLDREELDRGLEPDQCYYLENEPKVRGRHDIDLDIDPPPDLAIEVEVTRSALNRSGVYAALGVPEVWRYDGETLHILRRNAAGKYVEVKRSPHFPHLDPIELLGFLNRRDGISETELVRSFRIWVREQLASWSLAGRASDG
jgi:Uma2 family endonuclease